MQVLSNRQAGAADSLSGPTSNQGFSGSATVAVADVHRQAIGGLLLGAV